MEKEIPRRQAATKLVNCSRLQLSVVWFGTPRTVCNAPRGEIEQSPIHLADIRPQRHTAGSPGSARGPYSDTQACIRVRDETEVVEIAR